MKNILFLSEEEKMLVLSEFSSNIISMSGEGTNSLLSRFSRDVSELLEYIYNNKDENSINDILDKIYNKYEKYIPLKSALFKVKRYYDLDDLVEKLDKLISKIPYMLIR